MKTLNLLIINLLLVSQLAMGQNEAYEKALASKSAVMQLNYFDNPPMAYKDGEEIKGIEIDILNEFKAWIKKTKGIELSYQYTAYQDFQELFNKVAQSEGNVIGSGTITITPGREADVSFSAPYLRNVSVLVSSGNIKTARNKKELRELLSSMQSYTVKGSVHEEHLKGLYKEFGLTPKIMYLKDPMDVFSKMKESPRNMGYVDVITFWKYVKNNDHFVKMHSIANYRNENFGFIFPKNSNWAVEFDRFLESGFGFTATKTYHKILEKHLSFEILNSVELNP